MLWLLLLVLLVVLLIGAIPAYPYSRDWGYGPAAVLLVLVIGFIVLLAAGIVDLGTTGTTDTDRDTNNGVDIDVTPGLPGLPGTTPYP